MTSARPQSKFIEEEALNDMTCMQRETLNVDATTLQQQEDSGLLRIWNKIVREPRPRLTTCMRIFLMVVAAGGVLGFELSTHHYDVYERTAAPTVFYSIESQKGLHWDDIDLVCDTRRTPGGDCLKMVKEHAGYVAYRTENERTATRDHINMFSSVSSIILAFPQSYTRALTLGTFSGAASLNVQFTFANSSASTTWWVRHNWIPLMTGACAAETLIDAGAKPLIHITDSVKGCHSEYMGGTTKQRNFGMPSECFVPGCNLNQFRNESKSAICFEGKCTNPGIEHLGLGSGFGFKRFHCKASESPYFARTMHYLVFSLVIAAIATALTFMVVAKRLRAFLLHEATHQLVVVWPGLQRIAAEEKRPLQPVIIERATLFMCVECSAVGDSTRLARCFNYLQDGCHGAGLHVGLVVISVLPLHIFHLLLDGNDRPEDMVMVLKCYIALHYLVQLSFAICYYLRSLPLQFGHGLLMRMYRYMTSLSFTLSCLVMYTVLLWTLSAVYFDQGYVFGIFTIFGSCAFFAHMVTSTLDQHVKAVQKKLDQQTAADLHRIGQQAGSDASLVMNAKAAAQGLVKRNVQNTGDLVQQAASGAGSGDALSKTDPKVTCAMPNGAVEVDQEAQSISSPHDRPPPGVAPDVAQEAPIVSVVHGSARVKLELSSYKGPSDKLLGKGSPIDLDDVAVKTIDDKKLEDEPAIRGAEKVGSKLESAEIEAGHLYKDEEKGANELRTIGITGKELYATLAIGAVLLILTTIFTFMGASQWRGSAHGGYSATNLLAPLVVFFSRMRAQSVLDNHNN